MTELLLHYSRAPFELDRAMVYPADTQGVYKPVGLWISVGRDWERWCRDEDFRTDALSTVYRVTLVPKPNVLWISSPAGLVAFTERYEYDPDWVIAVRKKGRYAGFSARTGRDLFKGYHIDWAAVAADYDGLIIAPYLWSMRLDSAVFWYYGWDCASGCIWNLDVIERLDLITLPPYEDDEGAPAGEGEDGAVSPGELDL